MRMFRLEIDVYLSEDAALPETFNEWLEVSGLRHGGSTPNTLNSVTELRYPVASDVIERRGKDSPARKAGVSYR
jgi:hypothetical protein